MFARRKASSGIEVDFLKPGNSDTLLLCFYVDDIIYMSSSTDMLLEFRNDMMKTFEMSNLGPLRYFLGFEVKQQEGLIF